MERLNVCFVGVGSIAKRHIKNLRQVCLDRSIKVNIDALRRTEEHQEGLDSVYKDISCLQEDYDAVFITNPTECHLETLKNIHDKGRNFFIEKPLVSVKQIPAARQMRLKDGSLYYVACPLRYNAVIQWIKHNIDPSEVISVRSISSSYLPEWRPGQDYRRTYSAHRNLGGGVSIDLIHEWDYITYLFGWPVKVQCFIGKKSSLEIDSDDYAIYIAEFSDKIGELHLDYFGRKTIREIQMFCKDDTVIGDIANHTVRFMKSGKEIFFSEGRDDYQKRELNHFIDMIIGNKEMEDGFQHGISVIELTQGVI